ncbi:MAG: M28 family peptidase [Saprospiraceae bacterium]
MKYLKSTKILILSIIVLFVSCKSTKIAFDEDKYMQAIKADIMYLSSDEMEGREVGTEGERKAAAFISNRFGQLGLKPAFENGYYQFFQKRKKSNPHADPSPDDPVIEGRNVGAYKDNGSDYTIIIGAHYDHLGYGPEGSLYSGPPAIHNGADDNASGVATMMALAEILATKEMENNFLFLAFSGEEKGLWGSNFFVDNNPLSNEDVNFMINLDMVGRLNDENKLAVYGTGTSPIWNETLTGIKSDFNFTMSESGVGPSDHTSFYLEDIPVLAFFTGQHEDYHKPSDDWDKLNYDGIMDILDYLTDLIAELDDDGKLAFTKTKDEQEEAPDFKVTLGVIPDYLYDGKGMRIDGVREGRPAENAGLIKGDVVMKMGALEIVDMMSYMKALGAFSPGQTVKVTVLREGEMIEKDVSF